MDLLLFGSRLRSTRLEKGISQKELAQKMGVTAVYLSHVEHGRRSVSMDTLCSICQVLEVSSDYLLGLNTAFPGQKQSTLCVFRAIEKAAAHMNKA